MTRQSAASETRAGSAPTKSWGAAYGWARGKMTRARALPRAPRSIRIKARRVHPSGPRAARALVTRASSRGEVVAAEHRDAAAQRARAAVGQVHVAADDRG